MYAIAKGGLMAQKTSTDRIFENKNLIPSDLSIILKSLIHPLSLFLSGTKIKYKIVNCSENLENFLKFLKQTNRPIIFACNHSSPYDVPIAYKAIKKYTILFAGKQPLEPLDEMFFNIHSTIYVDRKDKEDMKLSKMALIETLKRKRQTLIFPEGTWICMDEEKADSGLLLEMKYGIIDVAKEANALIIPMALHYDYDKMICKYSIGLPLDVKEETLKDGILLLRDSMASLLWKLFELKPEINRSDIIPEMERIKMKNRLNNYPKLDVDYEKSVVFRTAPTNEEVFGPIKKLKL